MGQGPTRQSGLDHILIDHVELQDDWDDRRGPHDGSYETLRQHVGFPYASPEDAFVHMFSFLRISELNICASVSKSWNRVVYDSSLWASLDLSSIWWKVNDALVKQLLSQERFLQVQTVSLEGCVEVTDTTLELITDHCHELHTLLVTECSLLTAPAIISVASTLPSLTKLELYGVVSSRELGPHLLALRPGLDLGLYWLRCCALLAVHPLRPEAEEEQEENEMLHPVGLEGCRHNVPFAEQACWGEMKGRLVYSNVDYHRTGNYPESAIFSCQVHAQEDYKDPELYKCALCARLFREPSMHEELLCRVCVDREHLRTADTWITLSQPVFNRAGYGRSSPAARLGLGDLFDKVISLKDKRQLPPSLQPRARAQLQISFSLDQDHLDERIMAAAAADQGDRHAHAAVDFEQFRNSNERAVSAAVSSLRAGLLAAQSEGHTRALMTLGSDRSIQLLSDTHPVTAGFAGELHLKLTQYAWKEAMKVMYSFLVVLCVVSASILIVRQPGVVGGSSAYASSLQESREDTLSLGYLLVLTVVLVVTMCVGTFLAIRYRQQCLKFLQIFIFCDLLLLYLLGGMMLLQMAATVCDVSLEAISSGIAVWNFACIGLYTLYRDVPQPLHRASLVMLFTMIAVMITGMLNAWIVVIFIVFFTLCDVVSVWKPQWQLLTPFLIIPNMPMQFRNPRILFQVDKVTLRSIDLLWFGLSLAMVAPTSPALITASVSLMGVLVLCVFVAPYFGYTAALRPVPVAFVVMIFWMFVGDHTVAWYLASMNTLHSTAVAIRGFDVVIAY